MHIPFNMDLAVPRSSGYLQKHLLATACFNRSKQCRRYKYTRLTHTGQYSVKCRSTSEIKNFLLLSSCVTVRYGMVLKPLSVFFFYKLCMQTAYSCHRDCKFTLRKQANLKKCILRAFQCNQHLERWKANLLLSAIYAKYQ